MESGVVHKGKNYIGKILFIKPVLTIGVVDTSL